MKQGSSILLVLVAAIVGPATASSYFRAAGQRLLAPVSVGIRSAAMHQQASGGPGGIASAHAASILPRKSSVKFLGNKDIMLARTCESSRGGAQSSSDPANQVASTTLRRAYLAAGAATTAAWSTMVYTTIRSNQPQGAMMPCWQHGCSRGSAPCRQLVSSPDPAPAWPSRPPGLALGTILEMM